MVGQRPERQVRGCGAAGWWHILKLSRAGQDQRQDGIPGRSQRCDRKRSGDERVFLPESASADPIG